MSIFDTNILIAIVTKILSPIFPNKIQTHLLRYIFRQFLVYDNVRPRILFTLECILR